MITTFKYIKMAGRRPHAHATLVDNLMNENEIAAETSLLTSIFLLQDKFGLMQWLARRLIRNEILCALCQENCTLN